MPRPDRLFRLLQALRQLPAPVTAARLAEETGVSVRSIYRDIDSLRAAGAEIGGERGFGYCLVEDGTLPPQMFSRIEIEALVLGMAEVRQSGDPALAQAAASVLAKVAATLPQARQQQVVHAVSQVYRPETRYPDMPCLPAIREACWREEALVIAYRDKDDRPSQRTIWPLAVVYLEQKLMVLAWCCLRADFRMFRPDRIASTSPEGSSFRPQRVGLLRRYIASMSAA
ncbi:HTH domain-containing protein [Xylophilus rhododendri]|uniref:HTH domain-containing protein n=1 Tax=Xylophilus rhododendri TaxID=2697032 RepID=A0A857J3U7_9BURK|nr:YafY family protein [Xylophilus rhododendri]QHI97721.1 HTH domain-containing protein [Xylophilus rhododendri]